MAARVGPEEFYDALASEYHLLFEDWWSAAQWHGQVIAQVLSRRGFPSARLLDCTCGIGTQALPLARRGYSVTASDVSRAAVERALRSVRACLGTGGLLLVSLRDYDALRITRPPGVPLSVHGAAGRRHGSGQAWNWSEDAEYVDIELFTFTEVEAGSWRAHSRGTRYRALGRAKLEALLASAGFTGPEWLMPGDSGYYQPIVLAKAGGAGS